MSDQPTRDDATSTAMTPAPAAKARRWDPFSMLAEMESEMDRFFGHRLFSTHPLRQMFRSSGGWSPQIDMFDRNGNLVIEVELPGVNRDDVDVSVEDTDLIIKGERSGEREVEDDAYYRMERYSGSFYRRIPLPKGADSAAISAEFKDGVLTLTVPKPKEEATKPTKIAIS